MAILGRLFQGFLFAIILILGDFVGGVLGDAVSIEWFIYFREVGVGGMTGIISAFQSRRRQYISIVRIGGIGVVGVGDCFVIFATSLSR